MYVKRLKDDEILQIMRVISDPDCEIVSIFRKVTDLRWLSIRRIWRNAMCCMIMI